MYMYFLLNVFGVGVSCHSLYSIVSYLYVSCRGSITSVGKERGNVYVCFCLLVYNSVRRGFLFLWMLGMGCVILLWHSLSLPYNYFEILESICPVHQHPEGKISFCFSRHIAHSSVRGNMAYSKSQCGKLVNDVSLGSDTEKRDLCGACAVDGEYRPALKFCLDCSQPICQTCVDYHRRIKLLQRHKLVDNKNDEAVKVAKTLSSCLACPNHADKTIEFICIDHDAFCCSTCATVNHRGCRQVREVAALAQIAPDISTTMTHLNDAKSAIEGIVKLRQKNNDAVQEQVSKTIPKQIQEMKASIMKTFDELEKYLLRETKRLTGSLRDYPKDSEIVRWQSRIKTITEASDLISAAQQNGTDVHKYIAAKNTEKKLADIDDSICQAKELNFDGLSFSFDKTTFLQNASVEITTNRAVTRSLADIDREMQATYMPGKKQTGRTPQIPNPFASLSTKTTIIQTSAYLHGQPSARNIDGPKDSSIEFYNQPYTKPIRKESCGTKVIVSNDVYNIDTPKYLDDKKCKVSNIS